MKYTILLTIALLGFLSGCQKIESNKRQSEFQDELTVHYVVNNSGGGDVIFEKDGIKATYKTSAIIPHKIFSPDGQWILLPQTLWGDFIYCKKGEIFDCLNRPELFLHLTEGSDHAVYFRFINWESPATAVISFSFNNEEEEWLIDLEDKTAKKRNAGDAVFEPKFKKE